MSNIELIENDLRKYLEQAPNLDSKDKLKYLMAVFNKHFTFEELGHIINDKDIFTIISQAKTAYATISLPMTISGKKVRTDDIGNILLMESFISYLNRMGLLNRDVKFDRKE